VTAGISGDSLTTRSYRPMCPSMLVRDMRVHGGAGGGLLLPLVGLDAVGVLTRDRL